ncbi:MAG: MarR family winged helix-turn-helix transcriptional regulator [Pseudomonadota bacterium]
MPEKKRVNAPRASAENLETLDRFLTHRITVLSHLLTRTAQRWHEKNSGLSLTAWRMLAILAGFGPMTQTQIGEIIFIDLARISRVKTSLVAKGLVSEIPDPADNRRTILAATKSGAALYRKLLPSALKRQEGLYEQFSEEEVAVFNRVLDGMIDQICQEDARGGSGGTRAA